MSLTNKILKESEASVSYTAIVLTDKYQDLLKSMFASVYPDWKWFGHHMTICMGKCNNEEVLKQIGDKVTLRAVAVGHSDKAFALKVEGFFTTNSIPHITLSINAQDGGKPVMSNFITEWTDIAPFTVEGVVTEIYHNKKAG